MRIHGFDPESGGEIERERLASTWVAWDQTGRQITFDEWPVSRVFRGERFQNQILRVQRCEAGHEFFGSYNGCPIYDGEGKIQLGFITIENITARTEAEQQLRQAQEALSQHAAHLETVVAERTARMRETVAELEHFSYTITHDMRAPLRAMQAFAEILQREWGEGLDPQAADFLDRIRVSADRMDGLIIDSLNYAKVRQSELQLEVIDPGVLLDSIVQSYPHLQRPRAKIILAGAFPRILGNRAGLTQCFSNLLGNATKFVAPGVVPAIKVEWEVRGDYVRICFDDNGIGIPQAELERVWKMFERGNSDYEGTGVGLAMVRKVVEKMRGRVGVESVPGLGSHFWVEFLRAEENVGAC